MGIPLVFKKKKNIYVYFRFRLRPGCGLSGLELGSWLVRRKTRALVIQLLRCKVYQLRKAVFIQQCLFGLATRSDNLTRLSSTWNFRELTEGYSKNVLMLQLYARGVPLLPMLSFQRSKCFKNLDLPLSVCATT